MSVGCKKSVEEVRTFVNERSDLIVQMCKKVDEDPTETGVDEARKLFDAKKGGLKAKWDAIEKAQLSRSGGAVKLLMHSAVFDNKTWGDVVMRNITKPNFALTKEKLSLLRKDFEATLHN